MSKAITLTALIDTIRTTPDGGWAITLKCGQDEVLKIASLSALRDSLLGVALSPIDAPEEDSFDIEGIGV